MSYREIKNKLLSKVAGLVLEVEKLNDPELKEFRIKTCESNAGKCFDEVNRRCKMCTCFIDAKAGIKVNLNPNKLMRKEITHCHLGKWDDKDLANYYREMDGLNKI